MELSKCKLCGINIEDTEYGNAVRNDKAPYDLDICWNCLRTLKKLLFEDGRLDD